MEIQKKLNQAIILINRLYLLMSEERELFVSPDLTGLDDLLKAKQGLLLEIGKFEPLIASLSVSPTMDKRENELFLEIQSLLINCRNLNQDNNQLTGIRMNAIGKSLVFIEQLLHIDSLNLYGPSGKTTGASGRRHIGLA